MKISTSHHRCWRYLNFLANILAALTFLVIISFSGCAAIEEHFIQIPALKRVAQLGYLYNEKMSTFIPVTVFRRKIPKEFITETQTADIRTYTGITDSLIDTFNFFTVDKNTAVNILLGHTKPQGALSLLEETTQSSQQQQMTGTLLHKYQTIDQNLEIFQDELKENYNKDVMGHIEATHVVTGITWGSQVAVQVQLQQPGSDFNATINDRQISRHLLRRELRSLRGQLSISDEFLSNFSMTVTSDVPLPMEIPTTGAEVKEMLSQVPRLVGDLNEGKGVPLGYTLTPINLIRGHLGVNLQNKTAAKLNEFTMNEIIEIFQNLHSASAQLHQLNEKIKNYSINNNNCIPQQTEIKLHDFQSKFRNFKNNFTTTIKNSVIQVRSGLTEITILSDLIVQFSESDFEPHNLRRQVRYFDRDIEKIKFCTDFQNTFRNIKYFGAEKQGPGFLNSLTKIENNIILSPILILLTKFEFIQNEPTKYIGTLGIFLRKINTTNSTAIFLDCDFPQAFYSNFPTCSRGACLNGGTCIIEKDNKIFCECAPGFIGQNCKDIECARPGTCTIDETIPSSCKCREGYVKDAQNPAKCLSSQEDNNATLLFSDPAGIQLFSISQRNTTRLASETDVNRALDFHYRAETIFWSAHGGKIYSAPILPGAPKTLVLTDTGSTFLSIAIDWVYNHVYYTDVSRDKISVANLDGSMKKVLINDGLDYPTSIVVNPLNGWMYWVDEFKNKIERAGMDGSQREIIATTSSSSPYGLALDYAENRLYWTTVNTHPCSIHSMKPDGSDQKFVLRADSPTFVNSHFNSITIFQDYMYWRDDATSKMYRANKCNGEELTEFISPLPHYKAVQVYHFSKQPEILNQCANRTIICSHLCLPNPGNGNETLSTICACPDSPDGSILSSDGHTCS